MQEEKNEVIVFLSDVAKPTTTLQTEKMNNINIDKSMRVVAFDDVLPQLNNPGCSRRTGAIFTSIVSSTTTQQQKQQPPNNNLPLPPSCSDISSLKEAEESSKPPPRWGVCDDPDQFATKYSTFKGMVYFAPVERATQSPEGGWRWHKWGPYIGNYNLKGMQYLYEADGTNGKPCIDVQYLFSLDKTSNVLGVKPRLPMNIANGKVEPLCTSGGQEKSWKEQWSNLEEWTLYEALATKFMVTNHETYKR